MCGVFMDATFHGGSNDTIGGCVQCRQPEISLICPLQLSPTLGSSPPPWRPCSCHWQKIYCGINDTCDHWKSVTRINRRCQRWHRWTAYHWFVVPVLNIHSWISWIFEKNQNGPNGILGGPGGHWVMKKTWSRKSLNFVSCIWMN
jgi:hypothetical protein